MLNLNSSGVLLKTFQPYCALLRPGPVPLKENTSWIDKFCKLAVRYDYTSRVRI